MDSSYDSSLYGDCGSTTLSWDSYDEEEQSSPPSTPLAVEPATAAVPATGGTSIHTLTNSDAGKIMFKMGAKTPTNNEYSIKPKCGYLDAGATVQVEMTRRPLTKPKVGRHKFVIKYAPVPEEATHGWLSSYPRLAFKGVSNARWTCDDPLQDGVEGRCLLPLSSLFVPSPRLVLTGPSHNSLVPPYVYPWNKIGVRRIIGKDSRLKKVEIGSVD